MYKIPLKKNNNLLESAKFLRRNMTRQEKHLWYDFLRYYPIKIYKQRIIDNFIADFYCHQARLVIEVDESHHYTDDGKAYDIIRTNILEQYEIYVLRFSNSEIEHDFQSVCQTIDKTIKSRIS